MGKQQKKKKKKNVLKNKKENFAVDNTLKIEKGKTENEKTGIKNIDDINFLFKKSISNIKVIIIIILLLGVIIFLKMPINKSKDNSKNLSYMFPIKKELNYNGKHFLTEDYPIFREVIFLGDSYTYFLTGLLCQDIINYSEPGCMVSQLRNACDQAVKSNGKYVNIFIGPNDMRYAVRMEKFKSDLKIIFDKIKAANKIPIISSYLKSEFTEMMQEEYEEANTVDDYDQAIQELCKDEDVFYLDVKDINDFKNDKMIQGNGEPDLVHFNKEFYVKYINKLYSFLYDLEKRK